MTSTDAHIGRRTRSLRSSPLFRRGVVTLACTAMLAGPGLAVAAGPAAAAPAASSAAPARAAHSPSLQQEAGKVVAAGAVGYVARVDDGKHVTTAVAGLADRATGRPLRADDQFEIGSNTKTFTSVLALQLVGRGRLSLDDTVERHLPGVVPGGDAITVRMLLQHTSGIFSYTGDEEFFRSVLRDPKKIFTPADLVGIAVGHKPDFPPGTGWKYSNTNYILAGMIVEKVSGRSLADLVEHRIARPLGLHRTYLVTDFAEHTGAGYAHGYVGALPASGKPAYTDVSGWALGGWAGAAGAVVSTPRELGTFLSGLLGGKLLPAAQLAQMRHTVPVPKDWSPDVAGYGLGLMEINTPCGAVWGHGGDTLGHHSTAVASSDGRKVAITDTTTQPDQLAGETPGAARLIAASAAAEKAAVCTMLGK